MASDLAGDAQPIKVFVFVKRRGDMSLEEFHERWRQQQSELAVVPEVRSRIRRLELHHRIAEDRSDGAPPAARVTGNRYDGVAVLALDGLADLRALRREPRMQHFVDMIAPTYRDADLAWVVTRTPDVIVGPEGGVPDAAVTFLCILRRKPGMSLEEYHEHWLRQHGALFQDVPDLREPLLAYEQNHGIPLPGCEFDGVTQQWFASIAERQRSLSSDAHRELEAPDVASFLDPHGMFYVTAGRRSLVIAPDREG